MKRSKLLQERLDALKKPQNPYRKGTLTWSVMESDWEDLTVAQIAEVLDVQTKKIYEAIQKIKAETGYLVPHARGTRKRGE